MAEATNFTTPVGRLVRGSLYKASTTDAEGKPLVVKNGPNAGQPRVDYFFAVALPKTGEQHWNQTAWGRLIWEVGQKAFPAGQANSPLFAWKIVDGDSAIPNKKGRKPCDNEGYRGHWVVSFSSGYAPRIFNADGSAPVTEENAVKLGYYIQVAGSVGGNGSANQPGIFLNHSMVAFSGYGPEIAVGPDPTQAGFGGALPPGASAAPVASFAPPAVPAAAPPVVPNHAFLNGPVASPPPPPPAAPVRTMTPAAGGATYEQMVAGGWTDALLIQHGMMVA